jgi:hypothetical protein
VERLAIEQDAVLAFAVIAEPLTVIRHDGDDRVVEEMFRLEPLEQPAYELVRVGNFAIVGVGEPMRGRRRVRGVRLVEVEEREHLRARFPIDPVGERVNADLPVALVVAQRLSASRNLDRIVEEIEAARDACLMAQHVRRHRRAGGVAG